MDRFLLIAFLCVNWSHLALSNGRYNMMLFTIYWFLNLDVK